jgi:hypothetical protein
MGDQHTLSEQVDRFVSAIPCPCGGYADRTCCTAEELERFNCGMPWECCARAFVCRACHRRFVGRAEAPEME